MFNDRLASDHLYRKQLFTWLSLVIFLMVYYFVLFLSPRDVLGEIWELSQFLRIFLPTLLHLVSIGPMAFETYESTIP